MSSKVLELLKKLKSLADRGIDGEKETAERMLQKLMKQHGVTLDDIEGEKQYKRFFYYLQDHEKLLLQVLSSVIGSNLRDRAVKNPNQSRWRWMVTDLEFIEISAKWDFYVKLFEKEKEVFYLAFLQKHSLFPSDSDGKNYEDLTEEEKRLHEAASKMKDGLSNESFKKQLTNG